MMAEEDKVCLSKPVCRLGCILMECWRKVQCTAYNWHPHKLFLLGCMCA